LRHCATNQKVAGSIPEDVIGNFYWHNLSGCTMALGSTQPLAEMITKNISWRGKGDRCVGLTTLTTSCADCREILEPQLPGTHRTCPDLYRDCFTFNLPLIQKKFGFFKEKSECEIYPRSILCNLYKELEGGGAAVAQWLRFCATNRKVAGSIPAGVSGFFFDIKSFRSLYGSGVESTSDRNEYQEHFLGVKAAGA